MSEAHSAGYLVRLSAVERTDTILLLLAIHCYIRLTNPIRNRFFNVFPLSNKLTDADIDVAAFSPAFRRENVAKFAPLTRSQFEGLKSQVNPFPFGYSCIRLKLELFIVSFISMSFVAITYIKLFLVFVGLPCY